MRDATTKARHAGGEVSLLTSAGNSAAGLGGASHCNLGLMTLCRLLRDPSRFSAERFSPLCVGAAERGADGVK